MLFAVRRKGNWYKLAFGLQLLLNDKTTAAALQQLDLTKSPSSKRARTDMDIAEFVSIEKTFRHNEEVQLTGIVRSFVLAVSKGCAKDDCRSSSIDEVTLPPLLHICGVDRYQT